MRKITRKVLIIIFWLAVWQLLTLLVNNDILLVGPFTALKALAVMAGESEFYTSLLASLGHICLGFMAGLILALILAGLSSRYHWLEELLSPLVSAVKSVPVASFVIILLIWFGSDRISVGISFLVVFPIIYINTLSAIQSTDPQMLETARVFHMGLVSRIRYMYLPGCAASLRGSISLAAGMGVKSGVAAEVIGQARYSLGNELYRAKINLDTDRLFAWTGVIVLLAWLLEKLLILLLNLSFRVWGMRRESGHE